MNLHDLFADHQLYHSEWQMDHFITVRAGGTEYGCYKQALRELHKRYRGLKGLYVERELLEVDIEEKNAQHYKTIYDERRRVIKLAQKQMQMEELDHQIRDTEREFKRFYIQATALKKRIGDLTPERRATLDRNMWEHRLKCMAAVDIMTTGRIGQNTIEFAMSIPMEDRVKLVKEIYDDKGKTVVNWFTNYETKPLDLPESNGMDIRALVMEK